MHHRHPFNQLKGGFHTTYLQPHYTLINFLYNLLQLIITYNTNLIFTQLNRLSYFLTLNFPIYLLNFSLSTTTISFFSYHIDNSTLKLTNNKLSVLLLLSLDTILLSLSRRTTQHRVAQHPIADTTNTYTHATRRVCLRRRTIYLWMVPHPTANTTNTYRNTQEIILITSTIQSETLTMTHFSASTSTTHTTNPVHSTFGPAYSSDNAGDGPPSKRPTKEFFTSYTDHDLTNPTFLSNVIMSNEYLCDIIYDILQGNTIFFFFFKKFNN